MNYQVKTRHEEPQSRSSTPTAPTEVRKYTGTPSKHTGGHSRTAFAMSVYPEVKNTKLACQMVVSDIYSHLLPEMVATGWEPGQKGYTEEQMLLLKKYYKKGSC